MDKLYALIEDLEAIINEGKRVPLTSNYVINRDAALSVLEEIRESLPNEIVRANQVLEREAQIKEDANIHYENLLAEAEAKARAMTLDSKQHADKLVGDAQHHADQLYEDAQRQAEDLIAGAERKAQELVSQTSIMVEADREANRIMTEARAEAQRDRLATLDHCDQMLKRAEDIAIEVANKLRDERMSFDNGR